ncbi:MAG: hypothetical protein ISS94_04615 [Candidatus Syntrophoarchaeum sp.]|nr:hypothetical protein [Candidatus Syntrophoarchaeum sp.]
MGIKTISIREEVYETLKSMKRKDESVSDAVERLINKKGEGNLEDFFGVLKDFDLYAAEKSSEIMAKLLSSGKAVNALDVLIAGIGIANGAEKVATRDGDFMEISKVAGLEVQVY